jgi:hypothetical protein
MGANHGYALVRRCAESSSLAGKGRGRNGHVDGFDGTNEDSRCSRGADERCGVDEACCGRCRGGFGRDDGIN